MSTVVVRIGKDNIILGSESQITCAGRCEYINSFSGNGYESVGKLFRYGDTWFGFTGHYSVIQQFQMFIIDELTEIALDKVKFNLDPLVLCNLIRSFFRSEYVKPKENEDEDFSAIVVDKNKVFKVNRYFNVHEIKDYDAIGSGREYALGALYRGATVSEAIETAINFDNGSSGDIKIKLIKGQLKTY